MMNERTVVEAQDWHSQNQRYMALSLDCLRRYISGEDNSEICRELDDLLEQMSMPPALVQLSQVFALSRFELNLLLLCAGMELDGEFAESVGSVHGRPYPSFSFALSHLPDAHWSAITPAGALRKWNLLALGNGSGIANSPLAIDERILHFLLGVSYLDQRLEALVSPVILHTQLLPSQQEKAEQILRFWNGDAVQRSMPVIQLTGASAEEKMAVAAAACSALGMDLCRLSVAELPGSAVERQHLLRIWEREGALEYKALLLDCHDAEESRIRQVEQVLRDRQGRYFVSAREPVATGLGHSVTIEIPELEKTEQRRIWEALLEDELDVLEQYVDGITSQFSFGSEAIGNVLDQYRQKVEMHWDSSAKAGLLWQLCRVQSQKSLSSMARKLVPKAAWNDLVLPESQTRNLEELCTMLRQRYKVFERWGFSGKTGSMSGVSALFYGPSGTGKTMAAEVIANEMQLDVYQVDLSQIVSKYIGETETNLRRVFDAVEGTGSIVVFNEADSLFGRRSEVKDSHDRYANIEVSYLLQRMESYRGLAILTTNFKSNIDTAFLRRINVVVQFQFPDAMQRKAIWETIFPKDVPLGDIDFDLLSRLDISGGNIRNIALYAAFLAADRNESLNMRHLAHAARREYAKIDKPFNHGEFRLYDKAARTDRLPEPG